MPANVKWENEEQKVIVFTFEGYWTLDDYYGVLQQSNAMMDQGYGTAQGNLTQGYGRAMGGYDAAAGAVKSGYATATNALTRGSEKAAGYWQPYAQSGTQANALLINSIKPG